MADPELSATTASFLALSAYLTGRDVEIDLGDEYVARVRAEAFGAKLDELLALFRQLESTSPELERDVREHIVESPELGLLAQQIILLWYTSAFGVDQWKFGTATQYFRSHVWSVIGAHPPALSGGYFGYWKYPPEN